MSNVVLGVACWVAGAIFAVDVTRWQAERLRRRIEKDPEVIKARAECEATLADLRRTLDETNRE